MPSNDLQGRSSQIYGICMVRVPMENPKGERRKHKFCQKFNLLRGEGDSLFSWSFEGKIWLFF